MACLIELRAASLTHDLAKRLKEQRSHCSTWVSPYWLPGRWFWCPRDLMFTKQNEFPWGGFSAPLKKLAFSVKLISKQYVLGLYIHSVVWICHKELISTTWISTWNTFWEAFVVIFCIFRLGEEYYLGCWLGTKEK